MENRRFFFNIVTVVLSIVMLSRFGVQKSFAEVDRVGVGVGTGKIIIQDLLKPGARYDLTPLSVINTGNVAAEYVISVTYHEQQTQKRPNLEWFSFSPNNFLLEPGEVKVVKISLLLPLKAEPAEYFAYLEAHPIKTAKGEGTSIGVAAAAKLFFTVQPSNIFMAIFYRVRSFYDQYRMIIHFLVGAGIIFGLLTIARRYVSFDIKVKPAKKSAEEGKSEPTNHTG